LWNSTLIEHQNRLKKLQLRAVRIITGLHRFTTCRRDILYKESACECHLEKKHRRKLQLLFNIQYENTHYLLDLVPPSLQSTTIYSLEMVYIWLSPFVGFHLLLNVLWLDSEKNGINSIHLHIIWIKPKKNPKKPKKTQKALGYSIDNKIIPSYFSNGHRKSYIIFTQIHCSVSFLA
jgi:hypothetical protein